MHTVARLSCRMGALLLAAVGKLRDRRDRSNSLLLAVVSQVPSNMTTAIALGVIIGLAIGVPLGGFALMVYIAETAHRRTDRW
jgi:hypothetical protein